MIKTIFLLLFVTTNTIICSGNKKKSTVITEKVADIKLNSTAVPLKPGPYLPIMAWIGLPEYETTLARYQELSATGITLSYCPFSNANNMQAALDMAQKTGVKLFVSCPELLSKPEETVKRFMNHPALAGYFIGDEPARSGFPGMSTVIKRIRAIDNKHICYVNLLPTYAVANQLGTSTYQEYLDTFVKEVPVPFLSFDHYPVVDNTSDGITPDWYNNMEMVAKAAKKANKPFWAFALTVTFKPHPAPTLAMLRLQVFSDLAYGAQAIQYFSYWTLTDPTHFDFHDAPMTPQGKRTAVYDKVRLMNKEIKNLSGVFLGAKMVSVAHTGSTIPVGTQRLTQLPKPIKSLKTVGMGAVVSVLSKNGSSYLIVVNRDYNASMSLALNCTNGVSKILKSGQSVSQSAGNTVATVLPGDIAIYKWATTLNK